MVEHLIVLCYILEQRSLVINRDPVAVVLGAVTLAVQIGLALEAAQLILQAAVV